jgi:nifR3 family TIM-barrel protein
LQIKSLILDSPFILAPLAGYSDLAFRLLCREFGASLCYSEMISSHGLVYQKTKTLEMIETVHKERPVTIQLFGADPQIMGEAAAMLADRPIDLIDINMGCPVRKVTKKGAGAALMKNPELAASIIKTVSRSTHIPVTVKMRLGCNQDSITGPEFAKMAENNGACAIAVHGRTWSQGFSGTVDWQTISQIKEAVSIPVIGNGDIESYDEGLAILKKYGCDGVMIGRAALGNPWVFKPAGRPDTISLRMVGLQRHLELLTVHSNPDRILARIKNHAGRYFKNVPGGSAIRRHIYAVQSFDELLVLVHSFNK